jgi:two-component system LytT family response regulator
MNKDQILKIMIIDDEEPARSLIKVFLKDVTDIEIIGEAGDGFDAIKKINQLRPDLIFLDIQMPKLTGFEILDLMEIRPEIIFVTAYDQFAVKAFELNAIDYILKPYNKSRFEGALKKAMDKIRKNEKNEETLNKVIEYNRMNHEILNRIALKKGHLIRIIEVENIFYIEAQDDYTMIYTENEHFLKDATMNYFENKLDTNIFMRIHRSYIVNIKLIEKIEHYEKESYIVILKNKTKLKTSRTGYKLLKEKLLF